MDDQQTAPITKRLPLSEIFVTALTFLIPVFVIPVLGFSTQFSKISITLVCLTVLLFLFAIRTLRTGTLSISWPMFSWALVALPIAYALSALFSPNFSGSFFGYQVDADTVGFLILNVVLACVVSFSVKSGRPIFSALLGLLAAGWVVFLFQFVQIFFGAPFSLIGLTNPAANLIGKWNDFGLFAGLIGSLSLLALTALSLSRWHKVALWVTLGASLILLAFVNFLLSWVLVGIVALSVFVFWLTRRFIFHERQENGIAAGGVLIVVLFFVFAGSSVSAVLQNTFDIQALEVRPSLQSTLSVGMAVYKENPLFGSGPNTFTADWLFARSADIVATPFWDISFNAGFASIPTAFVTGGMVVGLAWIVFAVLFFYTCVRALLLVPVGGDQTFFLVVATALSAAYLFLAHIFYVPSQSLTLLLFLSVGLFLASLRSTGLARDISFSFIERPRVGFASALLIVLMLTVALVSLFGVGRLYASVVIHDRVTGQSLPENLSDAAHAVSSAVSLVPEDRYYRTLAIIEIARVRQIVGTGKEDAETLEDFRDTFTRAVDAATKAVEANRKNFDNFMILGGVYQEAVPLGIDGAYDSAVAAYEEARLLNPGTPEVDFHIAEMKTAVDDGVGARAAAEAALKKKQDYTPAILLLAQLSLNEGKLAEAISAVEAAVFLNPNNELLFYQLGLLYLENKQYEQAALALEKALALNPDYANASFFLGEAYVFLGRSNDARAQFTDLAARNPDSIPLKNIITALEKGVNPFTDETIPLPPEPSTEQ